MLTIKTSHISHVLMLILKCVSRDRRMSGNLLNNLTMLSYFSRSPISSSPEYKKGRYQVLEVGNEDNSLKDEAVEDTFQDAPPWISALYKEMKSVRKEMAHVKIIRDELIQVRSILNDFSNFTTETFAKLDDFKKSVDLCSKQYDEFAKCDEGLVRKIDSLREENSELKSKLALCEKAVDDQVQIMGDVTFYFFMESKKQQEKIVMKRS